MRRLSLILTLILGAMSLIVPSALLANINSQGESEIASYIADRQEDIGMSSSGDQFVKISPNLMAQAAGNSLNSFVGLPPAWSEEALESI